MPVLFFFQLDARVRARQVRSVFLAGVADRLAMVAEKVDPFRVGIEIDRRCPHAAMFVMFHFGRVFWRNKFAEIYRAAVWRSVIHPPIQVSD